MRPQVAILGRPSQEAGNQVTGPSVSSHDLTVTITRGSWRGVARLQLHYTGGFLPLSYFQTSSQNLFCRNVISPENNCNGDLLL